MDINTCNTHIIPCSFKYYRPTSIEEVLELLDKYGSDARLLAGGTDLLVSLKKREFCPKYIIDLKGINGIKGIETRDDGVYIGALTRLSDIERNNVVRTRYTALYEAVWSMASPQIRNKATIGGNLCNASPAADTAPPLLVYNAKLVITSSNGDRVVDLKDFFRGPKKTILAPNELLTWIILPHPPKNHGSCFIKVSRTAMDLAKASVAVKIVVSRDNIVEDIAVALGSVAPKPVRAASVEEALRGKVFSRGLVEEASRLVVEDISPITDIRSTAEYRRYISVVITRDALLKAYERAVGGAK